MSDIEVTGVPPQSSVDYALSIIENTTGKDFTDYKVRGLGLSLMLFGLAEKHAQRVNNLYTTITELEDRVFDEANLAALEPAELVQLYRTANDTMTKMTDYIKNTVTSIDWAKMETELLAMNTMSLDANAGIDRNVQAVAEEILRHMHVNKLS
jgi:hypothetical protein